MAFTPKKISEFDDITAAEFLASDFFFYIQSLDGCLDIRILKSVIIDAIATASALPTVESGIIANPGGTQAAARVLTARFNRVDTVDSNADSVKPDVTSVKGFRQVVQNKGANELEYFPFLGDNFLGRAVNVPLTIPPFTQIAVICYDNKELTKI